MSDVFCRLKRFGLEGLEEIEIYKEKVNTEKRKMPEV